MRLNTLVGIGLGIAVTAVIAKGIANSKRLVVTCQTVVIPDLPPPFEGFRLLHLTDMHLRRHSTRGEELLAQVEHLRPDLVCLGGDYAFTALSTADVEEFFRRLTARWPVAAILGNADYRDDLGPPVHERWAQLVPMLTNTAMCLKRQETCLWLTGVDDPHTGRDCLPAALTMVPPDVPVILLAHSPEVILRPLDPRVRLILSGHTHGGQICLPDGKALYHNTGLPACYSSGRHTVNGATLYVSRGIGSTRLPIRLSCLPEITLFTLTRGTPVASG